MSLLKVNHKTLCSLNLSQLRDTLSIFQTSARISWLSISLLLLILAIGGSLRFYHLTHVTPWTDERKTVSRTTAKNFGELHREISKHLPSKQYTFYVFTYFMGKLFGNTYVTSRYVSALAGTIAIALLFFIGLKVHSARAGLIAASILAVAPTYVYYSQEARVYSLLILMSLITIWFFAHIMDGLCSGKKICFCSFGGYFLSAFFTMYLHYFGLIFIGFQGLFAMIVVAVNKGPWQPILVLGFLLALSYIPMVPFLAMHSHNLRIFGIKSPSGLIELWHLAQWYLGSNAGIFLFLAVLVLWLFWTRSETKEAMFFEKKRKVVLLGLLFWGLVPPLFAYFQSYFGQPIFLPRYLIIFGPAFFLLVGIFTAELFRKRAVFILIILGLLSSGITKLIIFDYYNNWPSKIQQFQKVIRKSPAHLMS